MRILSIEVPHYRVLQNVNLRFDKLLRPQVFPLGSINGGGKSTLLQLVFALLTARKDPSLASRLWSIEEMEHLFKDRSMVPIANITIEDGTTEIPIQFTLLPKSPHPNSVLLTEITFQNYPVSIYADSPSPHNLANLLDEIAKNLYLITPANQPFLWRSRPTTTKEYLTKSSDPTSRLFAYEWLTTEYLLTAFRHSRDQDFVQKRDTGTYGDKFGEMLSDLNKLLFNKRIHPNDDFSDVTVILTDTNQEINLSNLSRGELKRLSLYAFFKQNLPESPIVLIDEVEVSFHPDWQIHIVNDLTDWAPNAQFILATHSYELCEALTPAHVLELNPPLSR